MSDLNVNDDEDSIEDDNDADCDENVQLGFIERRNNDLFHNIDWNTWDGGKVGGFPVNMLNCLIVVLSYVVCESGLA